MAVRWGKRIVAGRRVDLFVNVADLGPTFLELAGLAPQDLDPAHPPQVVSTGTPFAIVLLRSASALARLRVDQQAATPWLRSFGARWFYFLGPTGEQAPAFRARMQFYGGEDPATGSAAGCAIAYLVEREIVPSGHQVHLRQGIEISRASEIFFTASRLDGLTCQIRVAGSTVPVASGQLLLP